MIDVAERRARRLARTLGVVVAALFTAPSLHAQSAATENERRAERLFIEAGKLASEGKYTEACPKLEESQRLDPGLGTQFNLASCWERTGRLVAAWREFTTVAKLARAAGKQERERAAKDRASALEPKLGRVSITGADDPALTIKLDGALVERSDLASEMRVDPGRHTIEASAAGKKPWSTSVDASAGSLASIAVPPLESTTPPPGAMRAPSPPVAPPDERVARWSTLHFVGAGVGGVGVIGLAVGGVFVLQAKSKQSDANCPDNVCPDAARADTLRDAKSAADLATICAIAGGALVVGGAVLWLSAPWEQRKVGQVNVVPIASSNGGGLSVRGRW